MPNMFHGYKTGLFRTGTKMTAFMLGILIAVMSSATAVYADTHREFEYDVSTSWTNDDVDEMLEYATYWVGKIDYASSQNGTDPHNHRSQELHEGGETDCSWFVPLHRQGDETPEQPCDDLYRRWKSRTLRSRKGRHNL